MDAHYLRIDSDNVTGAGIVDDPWTFASNATDATDALWYYVGDTDTNIGGAFIALDLRPRRDPPNYRDAPRLALLQSDDAPRCSLAQNGFWLNSVGRRRPA